MTDSYKSTIGKTAGTRRYSYAPSFQVHVEEHEELLLLTPETLGRMVEMVSQGFTVIRYHKIKIKRPGAFNTILEGIVLPCNWKPP